MTEETEKTSVKSLIQDIAGAGAPELIRGIVKATSPLKIQMVNDEKLVIGQNNTYVPEHLTDYTTEVTVNWATNAASGGSGEAAYASHSHGITGRKKIIVHNALKVGDKVHVLVLNKGKQFFLLGRVN